MLRCMRRKTLSYNLHAGRDDAEDGCIMAGETGPTVGMFGDTAGFPTAVSRHWNGIDQP